MKNQKGFTLIEMIIVVVLLAITVGMTSDILISLVRSNTKTQVLNEIEQQANFVSLKIEKELRDALSVDDLNTSAINLTFTRRDNVDITYTCNDCDSGGTAGTITRVVGGSSDPLTYNGSPGGVDVVCTGACFSLISSSPQVVKINMEFRQAQSGTGISYTGSAKIDSSIVIRSTY